MSKYINADELKGVLRGLLYHSGKSTITREALESIIGNVVPSADVVEVVRCKDCINFKRRTLPDGEDITYCVADVFDYEAPEMKPDDFCSYGERRETE